MKRTFTLIELVISMGILSLIVGIVSMSTFSLIRDWEFIETINRQLRDFQTIDRLVESAFRNAITFKWTIDEDKEEEDKPLFRGQTNYVYFVYRHTISNDESPSALRFLLLTQEGNELVAYYRNTPILPNEIFSDREHVIREVVADGVASIIFDYALRDYSSGNVTWVNTWAENEPDIPIAMQIRVRWLTGHEEVWLRRTAGNGFSTYYDIREDEVEKENGGILIIPRTGKGDPASGEGTTNNGSSGGGSSSRPNHGETE